MASFTYPTNSRLREVEMDLLPRLSADRPIFDILPMTDLDAATMMWEQRDNITGLQQPRGLGGPPPRVINLGGKLWNVNPGYYGEFLLLDETQLTLRRQYGDFSKPVSIDDLVMEAQEQLLQRRLDRIEATGWTLLSTGTFSALGPSGQVMHQDTFTLQTFTAGVAWATVATATPLANLRAMQLLARGHSVDFGGRATLYINRVTANNLLANTNAADLYGRRTAGLGTFENIEQINTLLAGEDLPKIRVYDAGYLDSTGTFQPFIANAKGVLVGRRSSGVALGQYQMTRNANNADLGPGAYTRVIDRWDQEVPRSIQVHDGHNGGPAIFYPTAVVRATL